MQYWKEVYIELAEKINRNLPAIEWCDLWHDQVSYLSAELPFSSPAVFIGFSTITIEDRGERTQVCDTQIDFYLFHETFSDTYHGSYNQDSALEYLDILTMLYALFHGKKGKTYNEMRRVDMRREESGGAGNLYRISFQCLITDYSAQKLFNETENPDAEIELIKSNIPRYNESDTNCFDL